MRDLSRLIRAAAVGVVATGALSSQCLAAATGAGDVAGARVLAQQLQSAGLGCQHFVPVKLAKADRSQGVVSDGFCRINLGGSAQIIVYRSDEDRVHATSHRLQDYLPSDPAIAVGSLNFAVVAIANWQISTGPSVASRVAAATNGKVVTANELNPTRMRHSSSSVSEWVTPLAIAFVVSAALVAFRTWRRRRAVYDGAHK